MSSKPPKPVVAGSVENGVLVGPGSMMLQRHGAVEIFFWGEALLSLSVWICGALIMRCSCGAKYRRSLAASERLIKEGDGHSKGPTSRH